MQLHMVMETVLVSFGALLILKDKKLGYYLFGGAILLFVWNQFF